MSYAVQSRRAAAAQPGLGAFAIGLRSALRTWMRELAGAWRYAVARREFNQLDAGALRDLGISRSEFDSYWAESHGLAEQTRVRAMDAVGRRARTVNS
jgi:uncharacterized protein YjiS (DUF1127 family)